MKREYSQEYNEGDAFVNAVFDAVEKQMEEYTNDHTVKTKEQEEKEKQESEKKKNKSKETKKKKKPKETTEDFIKRKIKATKTTVGEKIKVARRKASNFIKKFVSRF